MGLTNWKRPNREQTETEKGHSRKKRIRKGREHKKVKSQSLIHSILQWLWKWIMLNRSKIPSWPPIYIDMKEEKYWWVYTNNQTNPSTENGCLIKLTVSYSKSQTTLYLPHTQRELWIFRSPHTFSLCLEKCYIRMTSCYLAKEHTIFYFLLNIVY